MINYILTTTVCWILFYLLYKVFLSRETFFKLNRITLLGGLGLGAVIPILANLITIEQSTISAAYLPMYELQNTSNWLMESMGTNAQSFFSWGAFFLGIYIAGVAFSSIVFCRGLVKIYQLKSTANITKYSNYTLVQSEELHSPFSFGKSIFISTQTALNSSDLDKIIRHEKAHIDQGHTWDVLFLETLKIIFWFNPLVYLYRYELKNIHEYLADSAVLQDTSVQQYGKLLLEQSVPGLEVAFANHFIYSQLKNRINMMTKKRSSQFAYFKYLLVLPLVALFAWNIAAQAPKSDKKTLTKVEQMPMFPGCTEGDQATQEACSNKKMMEFIIKNLKYPKAAKAAKTEGMAVIGFVVDTDGSILNAKIIKDVKDGCGAEALRVVNAMNDLPQKWAPGSEKGKKVKVEMKLPFKFQLN